MMAATKAAGVIVGAEDPRSPDAQALMAALSQTLARITGSDGRASFDVADLHVERARGAEFIEFREQPLPDFGLRGHPSVPPPLAPVCDGSLSQPPRDRASYSACRPGFTITLYGIVRG